jgi:hypothetical protein
MSKSPDPEVIQREAQVVKLRAEGMTWDAIAEAVGYTHGATAQQAYVRANNRILVDDVKELRRLGQDRLDTALQAIWPDVLAGDIPAVNALIRLEERRAKLYGLDMPTRIQAEVVNYDGNSIRSELARLLALDSGSVPAQEMDQDSSEAEPTTPRE